MHLGNNKCKSIKVIKQLFAKFSIFPFFNLYQSFGVGGVDKWEFQVAYSMELLMGLLLLIPNYSTEEQAMIIQQFSAALGLILLNKIFFYSFYHIYHRLYRHTKLYQTILNIIFPTTTQKPHLSGHVFIDILEYFNWEERSLYIIIKRILILNLCEEKTYQKSFYQ